MAATEASTSKPSPEPSTSLKARAPGGASPSTTITCSTLGSCSRAASTCSTNACSQITTRASASPTT
jgi:hypothetical protein